MAIPFLTNDQMHEITQDFLRRYHPQDTLPVPIEEIIELQLKLDIVPTPGLLKGFEIDGFLTTWIPGRSLSGARGRIKTVTNIRVMLLQGFSWSRNTTWS